jgi:hypothetical protein
MTPLRSCEDIRKAAHALLMKADVAERLPTPVDDLVSAAGLMEADDYEINESLIQKMPRYLRGVVRGAARKITGLLDRREQVISIDQSLDERRKKFVKLHEVSHHIFPWQRELQVLADTAKTLSPSIKMLFEREANQGAAELFFQVDLLKRVARDYPLHRTTPFELGELFGSSAHAAFRHWIGSHPGCVCGFVLDKHYVARGEIIFKRFECIPSSDWSEQFGNRVFPQTLPISTFSFLGPLVTGRDDVETDWTLDDLNMIPRTVNVQSFSNGYNNFVMVWVPEQESFVARLRKKPRIVSSNGQPLGKSEEERLWLPGNSEDDYGCLNGGGP